MAAHPKIHRHLQNLEVPEIWERKKMEYFAGYLNGTGDFLGFAGGAAIAIALFVLILLALREFFCWYWKINQMVAILESIDHSMIRSAKRLRMIEKSLESQITPSEEEPEPVLWPPMLASGRRNFEE